MSKFKNNAMTVWGRVAKICFILFLLQGCTALTRKMPVPNDPAYAPVFSQSLRQPEEVDGSIYQVDRNFSMYGDRKALNVGDILTVKLDEKTISTKSATTIYQKDSNNQLNEASILGTAITAGNLSLLTNPNQKRKFNGKASSDQSNSLIGHISVTVAKVMPNGILRIQGEKWVALNQGSEFIRITGLVRPEDIDTDNTIDSSKVANARISYGGTGQFDSTNRMGWAFQFFNSEWWPF
jgi:flagellar L-ring protein precursor FlgH